MTTKLVATIAALVTVCGHAGNTFGQWAPVYSIQRLALYGPEYTAADGSILSYPGFAGGSGLVVGYSERRTVPGGESNGVDVWVSSGGSEPQRIGLTAPAYTGRSGFRRAGAFCVNESGVVLGWSMPELDPLRYPTGAPWIWTEALGTVSVGLNGPAYVGVDGGQSGWTAGLTPGGQVAGVSMVLYGTPRHGRHAWVWTASRGTTRIGLTDTAHTLDDGSQYSEVLWQTDAGDVCGTSVLAGPLEIGNGQSVWHWDAQSGTVAVGLTGPEHTGTLGTRESSISAQNSQGQLFGRSNVFAGAQGAVGIDAWVWNRRVGTQRIGLSGDQYTGLLGARYTEPTWQTESGYVIGTTERFTPDGMYNGVNAWTWSERTGTLDIGLRGPDYTAYDGYEDAWVVTQNENGMACGISRLVGRSSATGQTAWVWSHEMGTVAVGLTDSAHVGSRGQRSARPVLLSERGLLVGTSSRIGDNNVYNGESAWIWTVDGGIEQIGLLGPAHTGPGGVQYNGGQLVSESGCIAGGASLHPRQDSGMLVGAGQSTWAWVPGRGTVQTGLFGPEHTGSDGTQHSENYAQSPSGCVFGSSTRYDGGAIAMGRDPWYFDPATMQTYFPLQGVAGLRSDTADDVFRSMFVLTADGILYSQYTAIDPLTGARNKRAYAFRPDLGFIDLDALVAGGLDSTGWRELDYVWSVGPDGALVGLGAFGQQPGDLSTFVMRPIPAPVCPADVTGDRTVDGADFVAFVNSFSLGDAATDNAADLNRDGTIDGGDFVAFMSAFAAGC